MTPQQTTPSDGHTIDIGVMYDIVMETIEKDLLRKNLPLLEEKYKGESAEEKAKRLRHYQDCLAMFDDVWEELMDDAILRTAMQGVDIPIADPFTLSPAA